MRIRPHVFVFAGVFLLAGSAFAQEESVARIATAGPQFGVKAGVTFATIGGDDVNDSAAKSKTGFSGGLFLLHAINESIAVQPEFLFSMEGTKTKGSGDSLSLNYLKVPVLLGAFLPIQSRVRPYVFAGPQLGLLISAEAKVNGTTTDVKDDLKPFELGLVFGAGVGIDLEKGKLVADLRYNLGLTTIDDSTSEADIDNRVVVLSAGYLF